jgi:guanylate kinase
VDKDLLERQRQPLLIVISGPSGVGKDTVVHRMRERRLPFRFVVTATSRPRRDDEVDGVDYVFLTREEFEAMVSRGEFLEHALVYGQFKGIPRRHVREALATGQDVVFRIDVQGAETVRRLCPEALLIFLATRDEEELARRLRKRRTESTEALELRLATARREYEKLDLFDYVVVNGDGELDRAVDTIEAIIRAEHHRTRPRRVTL